MTSSGGVGVAVSVAVNVAAIGWDLADAANL